MHSKILEVVLIKLLIDFFYFFSPKITIIFTIFPRNRKFDIDSVRMSFRFSVQIII